MALLPFMTMNELEAARFIDATAGAENRLEPILVEAGPHEGKYVLPERVKFDPAFADHLDAFALMPVVALDTVEAWPPSEDV